MANVLSPKVYQRRRNQMQQQTMIYKAVDEQSGKEVIYLELRRGLMKEDQMKKDESVLIPTLIKIVQEAIN